MCVYVFRLISALSNRGPNPEFLLALIILDHNDQQALQIT